MSKLFKIEISAKTIIFTIIVLLLLQMAWVVRELLFSFVIAFIVMSAFNPFISRLEQWHIPRAISSFIVFVLLLSGLGYLFAWIMPPVIQETAVLLKNLPDYLEVLSYGSSVSFDRSVLEKYIPNITNNAFGFVRNTFSNIVFVISTLFFSFYFLVEEHVIKKLLLRFFNKKDAHSIATIVDKAEMRMRDWLWGQLILMLTVGLVTFIGLSVMQIRYALPLAVLAGLLEVVPILGPIISAIPAVLIVLSQSLTSGLYIVALYFVIQQIENQILVPMVMRRAVGLSPIITLAALIIGGKLAGVLGILLSIPVTLCLETILVESARLRPATETEIDEL